MISAVCALQSGAQTLTSAYVELADSADRYMKAERWSDAERVIVKALRTEPANRSNYLLWSNLGMVRHENGDYEGALMAYDIGLTSAPRSTSLLTNRARTYLETGRRDSAKSDLDLALEIDSTLLWPRKVRGLLLTAEGDTAAAMRDFRIYLEKEPDDASVAEAMGDIAGRGGDANRAIELYRKAYRAEENEELLAKIALTCYAYGRLQEMRDDIAEGLKRNPRNGELYLLRALYHKAMYQTDATANDLELAREFGIPEETIERFFPKKGSSK